MKCDCGIGDDLEISHYAEACTWRQQFDMERTDAVVLTHERVACQLHASPFRERWPLGFAAFTVGMFTAVSGVDGIWDEARRLAGPDAPAELGPKALERVLDVKPACCRVSVPKLVELYESCGVGVIGRCPHCRRRRLGTPIASRSQGAMPHVCFGCIATASTSSQNVS